MKKKINPDGPDAELDAFLKEEYEHGINEFILSVFYSYILYSYSKGIPVQARCSKRIREITELENRIISLLDRHLDHICFYKNSIKRPEFSKETGILEWTTDKKEAFIKKYFKLENLLKIFEVQKDLYVRNNAELEINAAVHGVEQILHLKPINLLILTWANVMKKGTSISWINMSLLMVWFSKNIRNKIVWDTFSLDAPAQYDSETLRLIHNKYKNSKYQQIADYNYKIIFQMDEWKKKYPKIEKNIEALYVGDQKTSPENWIQFIDLITCLSSLNIIFHYEKLDTNFL